MSSRSYGIGIYAPAGFATEPAAVDRAVARLEAAGHRVVVDPTAKGRWQRFSATDDERLAAVMRMASDPAVELAIAVRGGYGWSRLLERLDFAAIAASDKRWLGHSDFTAFQLAALASAGMVTFAGPMAAYDFGAEEPSQFTLNHCWDLLARPQYVIECALSGAPAGFTAEGILWGGNLSLVAHLAGTHYMPRIDGGILFVEDVAEHPYRVERMLYQLYHAGILGRQRALLLGRFSGFDPGANDNGYNLETMIGQARAAFGIAVFSGLPFGHCRDKVTLPVGARCSLSVRDGIGRLALSHYTTASRQTA
ncbi:MAG: muramoyltetrapeptide carboxypeptidase [Betaproteobacteria bacterium]|nr:MAG: muramoyltetrapeptide carboxypeptidase [Betaproteobacteria bacterium]